ncbi:CoF synthetase [Flagellimonas sp.]|uniref:CoF synthetase n=1 Tax=Flagellimonas sp. TaxID=2058762 RepID=UPI003B4FFD2E
MKPLLERFRKLCFWCLDFFKGSPIRKHYNDITFILENFQSKESKKRRDSHLKKALDHAIKTVPFYTRHAKGAKLEDFPVINKGTVRDNYDQFKSDKFLNAENTPVVTSGSTGTPFKLFHNQNKRCRNNADIIYFAKKGGFEIGSRLIYMKVWNDINKKSPFKLWMENIRPYSIFNYTDEDIKQLIKDLDKDISKKGLVCFASTCDVIANYLDSVKAKPNNYNITSVITNSDALSNHTKDRMEHYFEVPVVSRYSNMECGMLAQQSCLGGYEFHVNWASFYIELLHPDKDVPVEPGKMGRVVVTDLFNYCMPLIRYDTGDLAYMSENSKENGAPVLKSIEGRKVDLIRDTNNNVITSHIVTVNMWKYTELKQYQFAQKGHKEYVFRLNPWKTFPREDELINEFKGYLGQDADINIEYVKGIPLLSSGKRKLVVNETTN